MAVKENISEVSSKDFQALIEGKKLVVADFFAEWCMPCLMMIPVIESLAKKHKNAKFAKVDVEESPEIAEKYGVSSLPCIILFKEGREIDRIPGSATENALDDKIKEYSK